MDRLRQLFKQHFGLAAEQVTPLQGQLGGSGRTIVRLRAGEQTAIGILYGVAEENRAFLEFTRHFRRHGLPVPEIFAERLEEGAYLEQDLGSTTLFDLLSSHRRGAAIEPVVIDAYRRAIEMLPRFQVEAGRDLNYKFCYPRASFDRQSINWDLNYFKYYFLRLAGIPFNEQALEDDFSHLTKFLLTAPHEYFLYRDFQSRNIMIHEGGPWFLDYQGGRHGALHYDIASLLYDGKADLPPVLREQLLEHYMACLRQHVAIGREQFLEHYYAYVYVRILQALGAYGFRGFYERKPHFLQSVPYALENLRWLGEHARLPIALPALMDAFAAMIDNPALRALAAPAPAGLTVKVFSFSYRKQIPADESGNGGGFVFDARALPNPHREEALRPLTGRDEPVIEYLNRQPAVHQYMAHVFALVDASVEVYRRRGFEHLQVSFGCTGGRHRSVFLAEQMALHLREQGVQVVLRHVEQDR